MPDLTPQSRLATLTPKRRRFVEEYLVDLNATQAALRAGYAPRSADVTAARLLGNARIAEALVTAQKARSERTKVDADAVLTRLAAEVNADMNDLYDASGSLKPVREWPLIWRQGLVAGIETIKGRDGVTIQKIKFSDRARRVEMLGKHVFVSAFREQVDHTSSDGSMSPPSLADFYAGKIPAKPQD